MTTFAVRFVISNLVIAVCVGIILTARRVFARFLSGRMQYRLWFLLLALLAVPFVKIRPAGLTNLFSRFHLLTTPGVGDGIAVQTELAKLTGPATGGWMNDFSISVSRNTPSVISLLLIGVWFAGMAAMLLLAARSRRNLGRLKQSALPLLHSMPGVHQEDREFLALYNNCLREMGLYRNIPIYSTSYLKSPVITGLLWPRIYLPAHLLSDYGAADMRYMLLHELQHHRHNDALLNFLMNLAGVVYWFNPCVWYALREMRSDREVACDTSVLQMLKEQEYEAYGNTLINFAEKLSHVPFPVASGIGGSMSQMKRRILNIAAYRPPTPQQRLTGAAAFGITALLLFGLAPMLSTAAAADDHYRWAKPDGIVTELDAASSFGDYQGSFVLYEPTSAAWQVYHEADAVTRTSPDSTYKIYDALLGLESGIITPEQSLMKWNRERHSIAAWNADQDLSSAMNHSVSWYFQAIDAQLGSDQIGNWLDSIGYGNRDLSGNRSSYWMESSLKISPVEQVELLHRFYSNEFGFAPENIRAVKDAIRLTTTAAGTLYGKTGTGRVDGHDVNGWFIGYVETSGDIYIFATNIRSDNNSSGTTAAEITLSILSDLKIWQ